LREWYAAAVRWLISRKAADRLPTPQYILLSAGVSLLSAATVAAICLLAFHRPRTGSFSIQYWLIYVAAYTISATCFALLGRHTRLRRLQEPDEPGPWGHL